MKKWEKIEGTDESFKMSFQQVYPIPEDRSSSRSTKELSTEEVHSSGASLWSLDKLNVDQLTLSQGFDHPLAMEKLSEYGPKGLESTWGYDLIRLWIPVEIFDETGVGLFLENTFLHRAVSAGLFLFSLAANLNPTGYPSKDCRIVNRSNSGPSGRPDRQITLFGILSCLMEFKTRRVCKHGETDVLDMDTPVSLFYRDGVYEEKVLTGVEKKRTNIIYQVCWSSSVFVSLIILKSPDMASASHSILRTFNRCQRKRLLPGHPERQ